MNDQTANKVMVLAQAAKYDVSCSSSGVTRKNTSAGIGSAAQQGICHSFSEDGRCISLWKTLMTNFCIYDCAYCINRSSNDVPRAAFTIKELVNITIEFYRRNYIEGLFLSSGIIKTPDYTMERLVEVIKTLRLTHRFNGYIHMKSIPGASQELVKMAGLYADRLSVNIEIPLESNLKRLAPEKNHASVYAPMHYIRQGISEYNENKQRFRSTPVFAPAGQSTQMIIGASNEKDIDILRLSSLLYKGPALKRVYYSGYVPVNTSDSRLPAIKQSPLIRENRLYQADWLMRRYFFDVEEIVSQEFPELDHDIDPKLAWALRHPSFFPIDLNKAEYEKIIRVPGIGITSAKKIIVTRRFHHITLDHLKQMGVAINRAQYFITNKKNIKVDIHTLGPANIRSLLKDKKKASPKAFQLSLFS